MLMHRHKLTAVIFAFLLAASFTTALEASGDIQQAQEDNPNFDIDTNGGGFFDFLLSLGVTDDNPRPGDTVTFDYDLLVSEPFQGGEGVIVVEVYDCFDAECDDGGRDEFVEATRQQYPGTDELVGAGSSIDAEVEYTVPSDAEATWGAVAYIYDTGQGEISSTTPETTFLIDTSDPEPAEPVITVADQPEVTTRDNGFKTTVTLENTGDANMPDPHIMELQVRPQGESPLSFVGGQQRVCDSDTPENVHKTFRIDAGDQETITLTSTGNLEQDQEYTLYLLSRSACAGEPGFERVAPYPRSENLGTFCLGDCGDDNGIATSSAITFAFLGIGGLALAGWFFLG